MRDIFNPIGIMSQMKSSKDSYKSDTIIIYKGDDGIQGFKLWQMSDCFKDLFKKLLAEADGEEFVFNSSHGRFDASKASTVNIPYPERIGGIFGTELGILPEPLKRVMAAIDKMHEEEKAIVEASERSFIEKLDWQYIYDSEERPNEQGIALLRARIEDMAGEAKMHEDGSISAASCWICEPLLRLPFKFRSIEKLYIWHYASSKGLTNLEWLPSKAPKSCCLVVPQDFDPQKSLPEWGKWEIEKYPKFQRDQLHDIMLFRAGTTYEYWYV